MDLSTTTGHCFIEFKCCQVDFMYAKQPEVILTDGHSSEGIIIHTTIQVIRYLSRDQLNVSMALLFTYRVSGQESGRG